MQAMSLRRVAHASPVAIALLIVANLVPVAGVLWFGWELITLLALYWLENGVVGVFAFGKIATAGAIDEHPGTVTINGVDTPPEKLRDPKLARAIYLPFFAVHYGIFWLVHGIFVLVVLPLLFTQFGSGATEPELGDAFATIDPGALGWAVLALFLSHGASFVFNWLRGGERRISTPMQQMAAPYGRVVTLHLMILFGAFVVMLLGAPIWALVVMVVVKTVADLSAHLAERRNADGRAQARGVTLTQGRGGWSISS